LSLLDRAESGSLAESAARATKQARHRQTARGCLSGEAVVWMPEPTLPLSRQCLQLDGAGASGPEAVRPATKQSADCRSPGPGCRHCRTQPLRRSCPALVGLRVRRRRIRTQPLQSFPTETSRGPRWAVRAYARHRCGGGLMPSPCLGSASLAAAAIGPGQHSCWSSAEQQRGGQQAIVLPALG
jgi:hypothetical protein